MSPVTGVLLVLCMSLGALARHTEKELKDLIADVLIEELRSNAARSKVQEKRVIGGEDVKKVWPYLVSMRFVEYEEKETGWWFLKEKERVKVSEEHFCGASLLNDRWLLTAAHCFIANTTTNTLPFVWTNDLLPMNIMEARLGDRELEEGIMDTIKNKIAYKLKDWFGLDALKNWLNYEVPFEKVIIHPDYKATASHWWDNDIALVKLAEPVPAAPDEVSKIQAVQLPKQTDDLSWPADGDGCVLKGWGCTMLDGDVSFVAQRADLPKVNDDTCSKIYDSLIPVVHRVCAGPSPDETELEKLKPYASPGDSGCPGDSGGPLMCPDSNGGFLQAGVTSFINAEAGYTNYFPTIFTRVSKYVDWIEKTTTLDDF